MFDVNLTKSAISQITDAQALNRHLSRLMTDIAQGRGYVIMQGVTTVSVVSRQDGERKLVKVYPLPIMEVKRYTKDEAERRVRALKDPALYKVARLREAIALQGEAMAVYMGELQTFHEGACMTAGMEIT